MVQYAMNDENQRGDEVTADLDGAYKSVYFDNTKDMLGGLNKVSPSFCLAKWFNVSIHIPTGRTHSCYHPRTHKVPLEELAADPGALHNTKYKKEQRKKMLLGERPSECSFCWDIEDTGNMSDRAYRSFDVNSPGIIDEALAVGFEGNPAPKYLEVNFNQACNLKCTYCSPHLSTEWHKEIKEHGPYRLFDRTHNDDGWMKEQGWVPDNSPVNPYLVAFWEWFPTVYDKLKTFRMTGGEPLMDKNTFKIFDHVKNNPKSDLTLSITSNCCPPKGQWQKFIDDLKVITDQNAIDHFMLFCSLDTWGEQAEYIRTGLHFDTLYKNVTQFLSEGEKHSLTFIVTCNILCLPNWMTYFENILRLRQEYNTDRQLVWFDTPMLTDPKWLSLKLASKEMLQPLLNSIEFMEQNKETISNRFKGFKDYEIDKVKRLYDWAVEPMPKEEEILHKKNFIMHFREHDKRRKTNLKETFPEMIEFIEECEGLINE
jgi:organic radical activating enzyme